MTLAYEKMHTILHNMHHGELCIILHSTQQEMDLKLSSLMIVIGRFEMDM